MPRADTFVVSVPKHNSQNRRLRAAISFFITPHVQANVKARPAYAFCHLSRLGRQKTFLHQNGRKERPLCKTGQQIGLNIYTSILWGKTPVQNVPALCLFPGGILQREIQYRQFCDGIRAHNYPMRYTGSSSIPAFHFHRVQEATFQKASQCQFPKSSNTQQHPEMRI